MWPWLVSVLLLAAAVVGWVWAFTKGPDTAKVPRVAGASEQVAIARVRHRGFRVRVGGEPSAIVPAGIVLRQAPNAGASLSKGARVDVIVSMGKPEVPVPRVVGLRTKAAARLLTAVRLRPLARSVPSNLARGTVLSQNPAPGSRVARGTTIFFTVSKGPRLVTVPAVQGFKEAKAVRALAAAGLSAVPKLVPSAEPVGTVVAQSPPAGKKVKRGSRVRINVSTGAAGTTPGTTTVTTTTTTATTAVTTTTPTP